jgi:hypothetical protein
METPTTKTDRDVAPGSPMDLAIDRALEAAELRAGDALATTTVSLVEVEASAAEAGDVGGAFDGDGD